MAPSTLPALTQNPGTVLWGGCSPSPFFWWQDQGSESKAPGRHMPASGTQLCLGPGCWSRARPATLWVGRRAQGQACWLERQGHLEPEQVRVAQGSGVTAPGQGEGRGGQKQVVTGLEDTQVS